MKTRVPGLIELECGWFVGIGAFAPGLVKITLQFDPDHTAPVHGVKVLNISAVEAGEIEEALHLARDKAGVP